MNGAIYRGSGVLEVDELPTPEPCGDQVLVKVAACGICGTDLHILRDEYDSRPPVVLGHEFAGEIVAVGPDVDGRRVGDQVTVEPHIYCGECRFCLRGQEHLCVSKRAFGVQMDGGFASYVTVPSRNAYVLPEAVDASTGALAEPLSCVLHGVERAGLRIGDTVVVMGTGPIGLMIAQTCLHYGASQVIAVEPSKARRDHALAFGASQAVDPSDAVDAVMASTDAYGADVVFEATGRPEVLEDAFDVVAHGARVVVFGVADRKARAQVAPYFVYRKELTVLGALTNPYCHGRAVAMLPRLQLQDLVTHLVPLDNILEGIRLAREGAGLKVQVVP